MTLYESQLETRSKDFSPPRYLPECWTVSGRRPVADALIGADANVVSYASSVFEGIRCYQGRPFALEEHLARMARSAAELALSTRFPFDEIRASVKALIEHYRLRDAYLRPIMWNSDTALGIQGSVAETNWAVLAAQLPSTLDRDIPRRTLWISKYQRASWPASLVKAKCSSHYVIGAAALRDARSKNCDDALLLDDQGFLCESTGANIILVSDGRLRTPHIGPALDGITLQTLLQLGQQLGLEVERSSLTVEDLHAADEVILCGTSHELLSISDVIGETASFSFPNHEVAETLREKYREAVS